MPFFRTKYTAEDMEEAVRLVQKEGYSVVAAARAENSVKKNVVPRITLHDRLHSREPEKLQKVGRPQELSEA